MKRLISMLMLLCLLLQGTALAQTPADQAGWLEPLQGRVEAGYTVMDVCIVPGQRAFVILSREGRNQLAIVRMTDGVCRLELLATHALRQGDVLPVMLADDGEGEYLSLFYRYEDGTEDALIYRCDSTGTWVLNSYTVATGEFSWREFSSGDGYLIYRYYENNEKVRERNIYGVYQREVEYLNVEALPQTLEEAREKLSEPPEIPEGELTATDVKFTSGKRYPVYTGPHEEYLRAAEGKAAVSTNDWIQVFGVQDGWALIQYDISSTQMRFGYIPASALPGNVQVNTLRFLNQDAYLTRRASLTDDPLNTQIPLLTLPEGAWVTWLATMGEWAYVESSTGDLARGFIPLSSLSPHRVFELAGHSYDSLAAAKGGVLTVLPDGGMTLLVDEWQTKAGQHPLRFEVYSAGTHQLVLTAEMDGAGAYRGTGTMTDGSGVLICPVYVEGTADMSAALSIHW